VFHSNPISDSKLRQFPGAICSIRRMPSMSPTNSTGRTTTSLEQQQQVLCDNLGKPVSECQAILAFTAARDDESGSVTTETLPRFSHLPTFVGDAGREILTLKHPLSSIRVFDETKVDNK